MPKKTDQQYKSNFEAIFGPHEVKAGRRYYKWRNGTWEETVPPKPLPEMRFDGDFISPVDGSIIRNKHDLHEHNQRNDVVQSLPGMMEDTLAIRKENYEKTFGEKSKEARREDIFRAIAQRGG
jgi:hypothetical protein